TGGIDVAQPDHYTSSGLPVGLATCTLFRAYALSVACRQKQTFESVCGISALPPKADIPLDVCFGPKADICIAKRHVRFTPESGHSVVFEECPLRANSGHCECV